MKYEKKIILLLEDIYEKREKTTKTYPGFLPLFHIIIKKKIGLDFQKYFSFTCIIFSIIT